VECQQNKKQKVGKKTIKGKAKKFMYLKANTRVQDNIMEDVNNKNKKANYQNSPDKTYQNSHPSGFKTMLFKPEKSHKEEHGDSQKNNMQQQITQIGQPLRGCEQMGLKQLQLIKNSRNRVCHHPPAQQPKKDYKTHYTPTRPFHGKQRK